MVPMREDPCPGEFERSKPLVPEGHLRIARRFNACHYPHLFGGVLDALILRLTPSAT